ncbi:MAG: hypothetical protein IPH30_00440 [Betaproteobacteria bacterium]|nr:hypothetical protein [Betaproteobacteria bacterium]
MTSSSRSKTIPASPEFGDSSAIQFKFDMGSCFPLPIHWSRSETMLFFLDANAVNARQRDSALNELERMAQAGLIEVQYTEVTFAEASHGCGKRSEKAAEFEWAGVVEESGFPAQWREAIEKAVFPGGVQSTSQQNDVTALVTAKLAGAFFVTTDGASKTQPRGILGSRCDLSELGIDVLTPIEAVALAKART